MRRTDEPAAAFSLRSRVLLLAGSAVILLLITLGILFAVAKDTQTTIVNNASRHLDSVATRAAKAYQSRADRSLNLTNLRGSGKLRPPGPGDRLDGGIPPPPPPPPGAEPPFNDPLSAFMKDLLRDQPGIEGGFYRADTRELGSYAFPTHEGPGPSKEMPVREQPTILELAGNAARLNKLQSYRFTGVHDVVLFVAAPVCDNQPCSAANGAIWLMQRLPGAESDRRRAVLWSAFAFGLMSLLIVAIAFTVLSQVDASVRSVLERLTTMRSSLEPQPVSAGALRMVEFRRVLQGLDSLASTLRSQRETERELQHRLQQQERLAAIGQLAAGVAHELRNPLATIRLRAQLTQRSTDQAAAAYNSSVVLAEVDRLNSIIERLLTFARPVRLHTVPTDVAALCRDAAHRWNLQETGCDVQYAGAESLTAPVDETRIRQVLDNLLENAVHASRPEVSGGRESGAGKISIYCHEEDSMAVVRVTDTGPGFSDEALGRAFEPFYTTRNTGTGLGLSIAYEIAHAHNGSLRLFNQAEGGAAADLRLPAGLEEIR